ncbi:hypothetical protein ABZ646_06915 [Streptomyces sp. NPDC007162]|uniref:winged helix-turn-helix transcriptional regulator n=1 Tax=Streptomyces sp. NPDC007162 TaxID=3156917 RepID=UPI0033D6ABC2
MVAVEEDRTHFVTDLHLRDDSAPAPSGFDLREHGGVDVFLQDCPTRAVLDLIAGKWTMLVLVALAD